MYKSFILLNIIISTTILLFAGPLSAQRIGPLKNAGERCFHGSYRYHENLCNRNSLKACVQAKNKFQHRDNKVRENQEERHDHKDSAGPAWLKDPDSSGNFYQSPLLKMTDKKE